MESNSQANQRPTLVSIDVKLFNAKFKTKGEVYRFFVTEVMIYLPPYETVTIWHMKDIAAGIKKVSNTPFLTPVF